MIRFVAVTAAALLLSAANVSAYIELDLLLDTTATGMEQADLGPAHNLSVEATSATGPYGAHISYNSVRYRPDAGYEQVAPIRVSELAAFSLDVRNLGTTWGGAPRIEFYIDPSDTGFTLPRVWATCSLQDLFDPGDAGANLDVWLDTGNVVDGLSSLPVWEVTEFGAGSWQDLTWVETRDMLIDMRGDRIIDTFYISLDTGQPFAQDNWVINDQRWSVDGPGEQEGPSSTPEPAVAALFGVAAVLAGARRR